MGKRAFLWKAALALAAGLVGPWAGQAADAEYATSSLGSDLYEQMKFGGTSGDYRTLAQAAAGKPVLLIAFAGFCGWCIKELPGLTALKAKLGDQMEILVVSVEESTSEGGDFEGNTLPIYSSPNFGSIMSRHNLSGIPAAFLFDEKGRMVRSETGYRDWASETEIENLKKSLNI